METDSSGILEPPRALPPAHGLDEFMPATSAPAAKVGEFRKAMSPPPPTLTPELWIVVLAGTVLIVGVTVDWF